VNGHLMASCVRNIHTKNYQNLIIDFQVTVENVGDVFLDTMYLRVTYISNDRCGGNRRRAHKITVIV